MTPEEYIEFNDCKPLNKKEIKKGKNKLKIYGTDEDMPWTEIYTQISIGISMVDIAEKYGHGRKIALFAIKDNIQFIPSMADAYEGEIDQRTKMEAIGKVNPVVHDTIMEAVNEHVPDLPAKAAKFSGAVFDKALKIVNKEDCTSSDLLNCSKAAQVVTDITGHTQRHSAGVSIGAVHTAPEGFFFVEDKPPENITEAEILEGETDES